jgi:hypothetical protein
MTAWRPPTLADAARRINAGEREDLTLCDFLSEFYRHLRNGDLDLAQAAIDDEPAPLADPVSHAHMGAMGEHLALRWGLHVPAWTNDSSRFLKQPHFTTPWQGFKAMLIAQSPLAFRRRLIFTEAEPLRRAAMPHAPDGRPLDRHEVAQGRPIPPRRVSRVAS